MNIILNYFFISFIVINIFSITSDAKDLNSLTPINKLKNQLNKYGVITFTDSKFNKNGIIRHIVAFRYKDNVTTTEKNEIKRRFLELKKISKRNKEPYIVSIETGKQTSGEGFAQKFDQIFIVSFQSEGDRNYYVGKPIVTDERYYDIAHQKFKDFVEPFLYDPINPLGAAIFDFTIEK